MRAPRMTGTQGMTEEEKDNIWNLHVNYQLNARIISKRVGMSLHKVSKFLKQRRDESGIEVKIKKNEIMRPIVLR